MFVGVEDNFSQNTEATLLWDRVGTKHSGQPGVVVIVVSVYGRFQIKLWRVLAFKPVISGDYSAAVELTFLFFFWPQTGLCDSVLQRRYQMSIAHTQLP